EDAPFFKHIDKEQLPAIDDGGAQVRLVAGSGWGEQSPVSWLTDILYADVSLQPGARLPVDAQHEERACYIVSGTVELGGQTFEQQQFLILQPGQAFTLHNPGLEPARLVLIGGEVMDGPRYIWWNFVSSRRERIEQAKAEWKSGRFDTVPGDV